MHLHMTAHSHAFFRKQKRTKWLRSRDAIDFTGWEITVGCLIEHSTKTHRNRKLEIRTNVNSNRSLNAQENKTKNEKIKTGKTGSEHKPTSEMNDES
ncbi:hypothetical protein Bca52824_053547 [Brassica carinata]|uniref:Uncharacterized protein n=2 Tax=Brassica TaxID=3705 RepID=A0A8X7R6S3_BRACI|nr:hypothetical protein Bca52824_053547 [Brassica carinata]